MIGLRNKDDVFAGIVEMPKMETSLELCRFQWEKVFSVHPHSDQCLFTSAY